MKILTITSVFPNNLEPHLGIFVKQRMFSVANYCQIKVVAPIYWHKFLRRDFEIPYLEIQDGIEIYHPKFFYIPRFLKFLDGFFFAISIVNAVLKIQKKFRFDIIDSHFAYPDGFGSVLLSKILKKPVVITLRGTIERLRLHPIIKRQIKWALNNANAIIAVSNSLRDRALELGIPKEKIAVIKNGVDYQKFFLFDKLKARQKLSLPVNRKIILSVGGLVERKGFHHVIDILPNVIKDFPNTLYIIVGGPSIEGDISQFLKKRIKKLNLESYVKLVGSKPHDELVYWYNAADVFVLFSSKEGCPNVILEALACGTPVVSSNVGGVSELIVNDSLGYLINLSQEDLYKVLLNALKRKWNNEYISKYGRKYTWDNVAQEVLSIFKNIKKNIEKRP